MMRMLNMLAISMIFALATGCQNNIRIKVEKVIGVSSVNRNSRIGRQLTESIHDLNAIMNACEVARNTTQKFLDTFPEKATSGPTKSFVTAQFDSYDKALVAIRNAARQQMQHCEAYFVVRKKSLHPVTDPRKVLAGVRDFCEEKTEELEIWPRKLKTIRNLTSWPESSELTSVLVSPNDALEKLENATKDAEPKFGGFASTDIYLINPSDPKYAEILNSSSPIGSVFRAPFRSRTSLETLSQASVGVSGDSAIMLVMEHPGQVRVYQVSMDPTQITRNIGLLVSKATAAGMKYLSGGV